MLASGLLASLFCLYSPDPLHRGWHLRKCVTNVVLKKPLLWFPWEEKSCSRQLWSRIPLDPHRGPFSCKPPLESFSGWVVSHFVLRQKAILHHLICSSHANKKPEGRAGEREKERERGREREEWIGRTRLLLLPTTLPTHGALSDYGKRITTTPLC